MKPTLALGLILASSACAPIAAPAPPPQASPVSMDVSSIARGAVFAEARCSGCHAAGLSGDSPMAEAPRLRDLARRYPVDQLAEAFAEGVVTAHPAMPEFVLSRDDNRSLIAYLESIQTPRAR